MNIFRYRHAAEKLHKTENVMEKYKKKLEESADLRRSVKASILCHNDCLITNCVNSRVSKNKIQL